MILLSRSTAFRTFSRSMSILKLKMRNQVKLRTIWVSALAVGAALAPAQLRLSNEERAKLFQGSAKVSFREGWMLVESNALPNHATGSFPNASNPNSIREQHIWFWIPLNPKKADKPTPTPFGPIGVAINGIPFYNQYNAQGGDAVRLETFDSCCGHPDPSGLYHYHQYPTCIKSPFKDPAGEHSPLIGFMLDGYAICGPNGNGGKPPADLDDCNGHWDKERGYHYHVTKAYPYLIGAYRGMVLPGSFGRT
jgi:hypothetical protein